MLNTIKKTKKKNEVPMHSGKSKLCFSVILLLLFFSKTNAQAPDWLWERAMGGSSFDAGTSIAFDAAGNVYTTGSFSGTADFDPGATTFNLTSSSDFYSDIFISKLDASGNFVWAKAMGATSYDTGESIAVDVSGNVYATGYFEGTVDFNPGPGTFNLTSAGGYYDIFILKLDSSGNFVWAKAMGGVAGDEGASIALDGSGNVYTTGEFAGTADFDPGAGIFNLTSAGGGDIFISKLDSLGNFAWAKAIRGLYFEYGKSIALDASFNIYTTGYFEETVDFDPDSLETFYLTSAGHNDIFISKLDSSGNFVWAKAMGGTDFDYCYSIALDAFANVYTTGSFSGTVDLDPDSLGTFYLTSAGGGDIFISKSDSSGNFAWAEAMGGTDYDVGNSVTIDAYNNVYTTGYFSGTTDFNPDAGTFNLTSIGSSDIFISKLNGSGNFMWAKSIGGTFDDVGSSIAVDAPGNVHVVGYFYSPSVSFDSTTLANTDPTGFTSDIFVAKLDTELATGNNEIENLDKSMFLFPNPAPDKITLYFSSPGKNQIQITNTLGQIVFAEEINSSRGEIDVSEFPEGMYVVSAQSSSQRVEKKFLKQ